MDGLVNVFVSSVFGFLPKCASKVVIFVVLLGISCIFSIKFAILELRIFELHMGSMSSTANRRFIVCISLSTIPVPLWSSAGISFSLIFLFLQTISNSFALNSCAWSQRIERGMPCTLQYIVLNNQWQFLYRNLETFLRGGIARDGLPLLVGSYFVYCFCMVWGMQNPFGFLRLVL